VTSGPARDVIGYTVDFATGDPVLDALLERAYSGFPTVARAAHHLTVGPESTPPDDEPAGVELRIDGEPRSRADTPGGLFAAIVGTLNRTAAERSPHLLVHAGAVERDGVGVVLPAPMESGKTTLTTGLVRAGFRYLTDEAAAFDRTTATLLPYPKPLSLDPGSWPLFPDLEPHEPFPDDAYKARQWQIPAVDLRPDALGRPCPARFVVFPTYTAGATTRLEPLPRAEALGEIAKNTFRFDREGRPTFVLLAEILRGAQTHRLTVGDLDDAVAAISRLVAG
jgi:hypothetical protein